MNPIAKKATLINIGGNTALFGLKITAGLLSGSIALISDALNSLSDIASSISTFVLVKIADKEADEGHPFGHRRAEPIAGLILAIFAGILGFEVIRSSFERLYSDVKVEAGLFTILVPVITIVTKLLMAQHFKKVGRMFNSPALMATSVDSMMDVFVSVAALIGIGGVMFGYWYLDPLAGFVISLWIIYAGYRIGLDNIAYLMGEAPPTEMMKEIRSAAINVRGVKAINTVRAHFVGNFIHVEIHIEVDKDMPTFDSHAIGKAVEKQVESIGAIEKAFVHIDPV